MSPYYDGSMTDSSSSKNTLKEEAYHCRIDKNGKTSMNWTVISGDPRHESLDILIFYFNLYCINTFS